MDTTLSFEGRAVLITGAGNAGFNQLGRAFALEFARRGAMVAINDVSEDSCTGVVAEIEAAGGRAVAVPVRLGSVRTGNAVVDAAVEAFGRLDVVVNNAGIFRSGPVDELSADDIEAVWDVHLRAAVHVSQRAFAQMKRQGYGRFINVSSAAGVFGMRDRLAYATAKSAMIGLSNVLSIEGEEYGIVANNLLPSALGDRPGSDAIREAMKVYGELAGNVGAEFAVPMVVYLGSEACTVGGRMYSMHNGWYTRAFIALGPGWVNWSDQPPSAEDIHVHIDEIEREAGYTVPTSVDDANDELLRLVASRPPHS